MQGVRMGAIAEAAAGVVGGLFSSGINLANAIYNVQQNERNFDYQKALQQVIFAREDNAVQRRMADLKAAGLNPNLAAGSAAGAGAVVGRSNTPGLGLSGNPVGTALDMASAVQQLRSQREQNKILKNQSEISRYQLGTEKLSTLFDRASLYKQLGVSDIQLRADTNGNMSLWSPDFTPNKNGKIKLQLNDSPLFKSIEYQNQNNKNSADLLQRDVDFYTTDKIMDYFGAGVSAFSGIGSGFNSFGRWNKYYKH